MAMIRAGAANSSMARTLARSAQHVQPGLLAGTKLGCAPSGRQHKVAHLRMLGLEVDRYAAAGERIAADRTDRADDDRPERVAQPIDSYFTSDSKEVLDLCRAGEQGHVDPAGDELGDRRV